MTCDIEKCLNYRKKGNRFSISDDLDVEYMIRDGCPILKELERWYNKYCIAKNQREKDTNDPSSQEETRKASSILTPCVF